MFINARSNCAVKLLSPCRYVMLLLNFSAANWGKWLYWTFYSTLLRVKFTDDAAVRGRWETAVVVIGGFAACCQH